MKMIHRSFAVLFALVLFAVISASGQATVSAMSDPQWHRDPVDNSYMNRLIADAAEKYKEYAPIPRISFYDIGYPKDVEEAVKMNGYAVLLISALSQDPDELPLKRAYVRAGGKDFDLKNLKVIKIRSTDTASQNVKTFGQYRVDALYLIPIHLRFQKGELLIDFNKNRDGMRLAKFDGTVPSDIKFLPDTMPDEKASFQDALEKFLKREYPGYLEN